MKLFTRRTQPLVLKQNEKHNWTQALIQHHNIPKTHEKIAKKTRKLLENIPTHELMSEKRIAQLPERSQDYTRESARAVQEHAQDLAHNIRFEEPIRAQEEIDAALAAINQYREQAAKHEATLKEHSKEALIRVRDAIQALEDHLMRSAQELTTTYEKIIRIDTLLESLEEERKKRHTYEKTLDKYRMQLDEVEERQERHKERIKEQKRLAREPKALKALEEIKVIERARHELREQYSKLAFDTLRHLKKSALTIDEQTKTLLKELREDAQTTLEKKPDTLKEALKNLSQALEDVEEEDPRSVVERLQKAAKAAQQDAQKLSRQDLHALKKEMIKDIAALNIYEQEQFLLRAQEDARGIKDRIAVLEELTQELQDETIEEEITTLTKELDAIIKHNEERA